MNDTIPTWLKIMENGALGEARTRAFLADRFWVMERSVDVDGADFLIQRRAITERFTDKLPPRVGVIQSKFFQDRGTTHHINKSYVLDGSGMPIEGFFALLHVGREDDGEMYLLSARDIASSLITSATHTPEKYIVGASALERRFKITSRGRALDQIEHSLRSQTLSQATIMLDRLHVPFRRFADGDIDFEWTTPLPNPIADVPELFREKKEDLRSLLFDIEEVLETFDRIFMERDPVKAISLLKDVREHVNGHGQLGFGSYKDFRWEDLQDAIDVHQRWREGLVRDGLLDAYLLMAAKLREQLSDHVSAAPLGTAGDFLEADLSFDSTTFVISDLKVATGKAGGRQPEIIEPGRVRLRRAISGSPSSSKALPADLADHVWAGVMRAVLDSRYPDPYA